MGASNSTVIHCVGLCRDQFETHEKRSVNASRQSIWAVVETIGGRNGFFSWPLAWGVRAEIDKLAGGPGFLQHRASPGRLTVGDTIDFLTVSAVRLGHYVRFATDETSPGIGSLEIWIDEMAVTEAPGIDRQSVLHLRARWLPRGFSGRLYWLALKPFHLVIFPEMLFRIDSLAVQSPGAR